MLNNGTHRGEESILAGSTSSTPAALTDTGCARELNEDRFAVVDGPSGVAWLVCDGMGGVAGGELAAQLAIDAMRRELESSPPRKPEMALRIAILEANRVIVLRRQNPLFSSMGTTVVGALMKGNELALAHVGDSRAYLVRNGSIQQLTIDHTYVQQLVDSGQVNYEDALSHPQAHILTRAIGSDPALMVDQKRFWISSEPGDMGNDIIVLATDGLYSHVNDAEICESVSRRPTQAACSELVELAKERGGYDNITIAVIPLKGRLRESPPAGFKDELVVAEGIKSSVTPLLTNMFQSASPAKFIAISAGLTLILMVLVSLLYLIWA